MSSKTWFFKLLDWAVNLQLPQAQKVTLLVLVRYANQDYECHPGQTRLANNTGMSVRSVRNALKSLEQSGIIHRQKRHSKDGYRTSDNYILNYGFHPE